MNPGERGVGDHLLEHVERVVADDAQVGQSRGVDPAQQTADAGPVYFDRDEVGCRIGGGHLERGLAHARTDLDDERRFAPEHGDAIEQPLCIGDRITRTELFQRARLRGRGAALAQDVASDRAPLGQTIQAALGCDVWMVPPTGDEGLAL